MSALQQIKTAIEALPAREFCALAGWMTGQHLKVLAQSRFQTAELEAALLESQDSPRHEVNDALFAEIRARGMQTLRRKASGSA